MQAKPLLHHCPEVFITLSDDEKVIVVGRQSLQSLGSVTDMIYLNNQR